MDFEGLHKHGLPSRDRSADIPEHATSAGTWVAGAVMVALLGLVLFGFSRTDTTTANLNTEQGMTTGAAPASPSERTQ